MLTSGSGHSPRARHWRTRRGQATDHTWFLGPTSRRLIHTEACAGSTARLTTSSSSRPHGFEVDGVPQPCREGRNRRLRVVAGAVEAAIDHALDPDSERVEQSTAARVDAATATGEEKPSTLVTSVTTPTYTPTTRPVTMAYDSVRLIRRSIS